PERSWMFRKRTRRAREARLVIPPNPTEDAELDVRFALGRDYSRNSTQRFRRLTISSPQASAEHSLPQRVPVRLHRDTPPRRAYVDPLVAGFLARGSSPSTTFPGTRFPVVSGRRLAAYSCGGSRGIVRTEHAPRSLRSLAGTTARIVTSARTQV